MAYKADYQDFSFVLFEWLKIQDFSSYAPYREQNRELYEMIAGEALKFSQNELAPLNAPGDREGCRLENGQVYTPKGFPEAYRKFAENGFIGIDTPPDNGGQGLPAVMLASLYEFFTGANVAFSIYTLLTRGSAHLIETFGTPELIKTYCQKMYGGNWAGTMCLTEPAAGSAVGDLVTKATPTAEAGVYSISGNKLFISGGDSDLAENIVHLVLARVEGDPAGTKGISLFVVPKTKVKADGSLGESNDVQCVNIEHKMGIKASATCLLSFGEKDNCQGYLLGERCQGLKYMFQMMNEARLMCAVQGVATASTAYRHALDYARERVQGGKNTILNYPDVRRNLSISKAYVEGMRAMLFSTASLIDVAHHDSDENKRQRAKNRVDLLTPICKAYCTDMGFKVTELAVQVYGGYGYCSEYPVEQYLRDIKISSIYEGANGIQALDLIGRKLGQNQGALLRELYEDITAFVESLSGGALAAEAAALKKAADAVGQSAMSFATQAMSGDLAGPQLFATPFLEMCGHTVCAYHLLQQAAQLQSSADKSFSRDKIRTAKFFIHHILPVVISQSKVIAQNDRSALEMEW